MWTRVSSWCRSSSRRWSGDRGELKFTDVREPIVISGGLVVLVGVPETDVVGRIDCGHSIISPALSTTGLGTASTRDNIFPLGQVV